MKHILVIYFYLQTLFMVESWTIFFVVEKMKFSYYTWIKFKTLNIF